MDLTATLAEISALSIEERMKLAEAIWDTIEADSELLPLSNAQRHKLERRLAAHELAPDDVVPWDEVRAQALARARP